MDPVRVHVCFDADNEIENLRNFHRKAVDYAQENRAIIKRLNIERKLRRESERSIQQTSDINRNRFDRLTEVELGSLFSEPTDISLANKRFNEKDIHSNKRCNKSVIEYQNGEFGKSSSAGVSSSVPNEKETLSRYEEKIDSLVKNTAMVHSLLNSASTNQNSAQSHSLPGEAESNLGSKSFVPANNRSINSFAQGDLNNTENNNDADRYFEHIKHIGSTMEDFLGVVKPFIDEFKQGTGQSECLPHFKKKDKVGRSKKKLAGNRTTKIQSQMNHLIMSKRPHVNNTTENTSETPVKAEHKPTKKGTPKALKRMQKIALDHNL